MLPDVLVVGAQRGGTSSLYTYLGRHPSVAPSLRKETEYFSRSFSESELWYRAHFPLRTRALLWRALGKKLVAFEATPDYLVHPLAAERAAALVPDAKIIALVRDPVERAYSQYKHNIRLGHERRSFDTAVAEEPALIEKELAKLEANPAYTAVPFLRYSYLTRGLYDSQLARWYEHFPPERIMVVPSEDFYRATPETFRRILDFLDLPHWEPEAFRNYSYTTGQRTQGDSALPEHLRHQLGDQMKSANEALFARIGRKLEWS